MSEESDCFVLFNIASLLSMATNEAERSFIVSEISLMLVPVEHPKSYILELLVISLVANFEIKY